MRNLENLLAASGTFRTWVGAADAAAAKGSIHLHGVVGDQTLPYALITRESFSWTRSGRQFATGTAQHSLMVTFFSAPDSGADDEEDAFRIHDNNVGGIITDMAAASGTSGYRLPDSFEEVLPPTLDSEGLFTDAGSDREVIASAYSA